MTSTIQNVDETPVVQPPTLPDVSPEPVRRTRASHRARPALVSRLSKLPYGAQVAGVLSVLLGAQYWPLLTGRVALPTAFLRTFPALFPSFGSHIPALKTYQLADLTTQQYPWQVFNASALRSGHLPLWDPHILMGVPQVASWLPAVFDPWHLGYLVMPVIVWWGLLFPLHQLVAGVGAAFLGRRLTGSRMAGLIAGLMYGLGGFVAGHNGQNQGELACMFPLLLLALLRLAERPDVRRAVVMGLVLAVMVLVGHPETLAFACAVAVVMALVLAFGPAASVRRPFSLNLALSVAVGLGCSAAQWLPGIGWLAGLGRFQSGALHVHAAGIGVLDFFSRDSTSAINSAGIMLPSAGTYLGITGLLLALYGLVRWRRDVFVSVFALIALISGLIAFGVPPLYNLASLIPVLKTMRLDFLLMVTDLSISLLAAYGYVQLRETAATGKAAVDVATAYVVGAVGVCLGIGILALKTRHGIGVWFSFAHGPFGAAVIGAASLVLVLPAVARRRAALVLLVLLVGLDLTTASFGYHEFTPSNADVYRTPAVVTALEHYDRSSNYRILEVGRTLPLNWALPIGVSDPLGYGPYQSDTLSFWKSLTRQRRAGHMTALGGRLSAVPDPRLDLANVKYVLVSYNPLGEDETTLQLKVFKAIQGAFRRVLRVGDVYVFENPHDLGPAVIVPLAGVHRSTQAEANRVLDSAAFSPTRRAVVASDVTGVAAGDAPHPNACGCVTHFRSDGDTTTFRVSAKRASLVVVSQSWYPGWHATVNGRPMPVTQADVDLTGVPVPAGTSSVVLSFQPATQTIGIWVSVTTTVAAVGLLSVTGWFVRRRRARPRPRSEKGPE